MAVIEIERAPAKPERAIFVASDGRRARRLRRAGFAVALVACLWVVGLAVGMLGFGSLPGVSVVKEQIDKLAGAPDARGSQLPENVSVPTSRRAIPDESLRVSIVPATHATVARMPARTRAVRSRPVSRRPAKTTPPPAAQAPVNPATRVRGWARRGSTAPPGKVRQTVTPPPPSTRGQRRGQDPTAPRPVPSGQQKKAETPPPPPPPQKKA